MSDRPPKPPEGKGRPPAKPLDDAARWIRAQAGHALDDEPTHETRLPPEGPGDSMETTDPRISIGVGPNLSALMSPAIKKLQEDLDSILNRPGIVGRRFTGIDADKIHFEVELEPENTIDLQEIQASLGTQFPGEISRFSHESATNTLFIDMPNPAPETVSLLEVMLSERYQTQRQQGGLPLALGRIDKKRRGEKNEPVAEDLRDHPRWLLAGQKEAKNMGMDAMLTGLLYDKRPDELKLVLIDPEGNSLDKYAAVPHLEDPGEPVTRDATKALDRLERLVEAMGWRHEKILRGGLKNIDEYNAQHEPKMPYLVVAITEFAGLMAHDPVNFTHIINDFCKLGKVTGVHLLMGTDQLKSITPEVANLFQDRLSYQASANGEVELTYRKSDRERLQLNRVVIDEVMAKEAIEAVKEHALTEDTPATGTPALDTTVMDAGLPMKIAMKRGGNVSTTGTLPPLSPARARQRTAPVPAPAAESLSDGLRPLPAQMTFDIPPEEAQYLRAIAIVRARKDVNRSDLMQRLNVDYKTAQAFIDRMEKEKIISPKGFFGGRTILYPRP